MRIEFLNFGWTKKMLSFCIAVDRHNRVFSNIAVLYLLQFTVFYLYGAGKSCSSLTVLKIKHRN